MRGQHQNSQDNLKPFKKGESGNPSGRTKAFSGIKEELKKYVNETHEVYYEFTHKEKIVHGIVEKAEDGDWRAIELLEKLGCLD